MDTHNRHLTSDELITYADAPGRLSPAKRAALEAHLQHCGACRQRLMTSDDIGDLLRAHFPKPEPAPDRVAAIMAALDDLPASRTIPPAAGRPPLLFRRRSWWLTMVTALVLIILIVGTTITAMSYSWNLSPLGRVVERIEDTGRTPSGNPVNGDTVSPAPGLFPATAGDLEALPFDPAIPTDLPGGFHLTEQYTDGELRLVLHYENDVGVPIELSQSPAGALTNAVPLEIQQLHNIEGVEVLVNQEPAFASVASAIWVHEGVTFTLLVMEFTVTRNVSVALAELIVGAILDLANP